MWGQGITGIVCRRVRDEQPMYTETGRTKEAKGSATQAAAYLAASYARLPMPSDCDTHTPAGDGSRGGRLVTSTDQKHVCGS